MGQRLTTLASEDPAFRLAGLLEKKRHPLIGVQSHGVAVSDDPRKTLKQCDVALDFSEPQAALTHLRLLAGSSFHRRGRAVVGTTGFTSSQRGAISRLSRRMAILLSPNMSTGMNLLFRLCEEASRILSGYDVEIVEAHHRGKKDSPSGSALALVEAVRRPRSVSNGVLFGRRGMSSGRTSGEIGVHSVRGGDIAGDHTVLFAGPGERLELAHKATSRDAFALGALRAARWIYGKRPGLYSMKDVLA